MAIAWFVAPYKRRGNVQRSGNVPYPSRYCAMDDFTRQIRADNGDWTETEVLGDCAIVKVRARPATLNQIQATGGFYRFPVTNYNASLNSLSDKEEQELHSILEVMGYTPQEIKAALGTNFRNKKLSDILGMAATRRKKPRYDHNTDTIIIDGIDQTCRHPDSVDAEVKE